MNKMMKSIILSTFVFGVAGCFSGENDSISGVSSSVIAIAPHGIYLGMTKKSIEKLHPVELRNKNKQYGVLIFSEGVVNGEIQRMHIMGSEITDSLLGDNYMFDSTRRPGTFGFVKDADSGQSYVTEIKIERDYLIKGECIENLVSFKKKLIDKIGKPKRVSVDTEREFKGYYQEVTEKRDDSGRKIKEGMNLYVIASCRSRYSHGHVFLQIYGKHYDLMMKYLPKE